MSSSITDPNDPRYMAGDQDHPPTQEEKLEAAKVEREREAAIRADAEQDRKDQGLGTPEEEQAKAEEIRRNAGGGQQDPEKARAEAVGRAALDKAAQTPGGAINPQLGLAGHTGQGAPGRNLDLNSDFKEGGLREGEPYAGTDEKSAADKQKELEAGNAESVAKQEEFAGRKTSRK